MCSTIHLYVAVQHIILRREHKMCSTTSQHAHLYHHYSRACNVFYVFYMKLQQSRETSSLLLEQEQEEEEQQQQEPQRRSLPPSSRNRQEHKQQQQLQTTYGTMDSATSADEEEEEEEQDYDDDDDDDEYTYDEDDVDVDEERTCFQPHQQKNCSCSCGGGGCFPWLLLRVESYWQSMTIALERLWDTSSFTASSSSPRSNRNALTQGRVVNHDDENEDDDDYDDDDDDDNEESIAKRLQKRWIVTFWFGFLALAYAGERCTFQWIVDQAGPFRLFSVEMVTGLHALLLAIGMLSSLLQQEWKRLLLARSTGAAASFSSSFRAWQQSLVVVPPLASSSSNQNHNNNNNRNNNNSPSLSPFDFTDNLMGNNSINNNNRMNNNTINQLPLGLPLVDIGLMALLDVISLMLLFLTGNHVSPTLTVLLMQAILPITNLLMQCTNPNGCCRRHRRRRSTTSNTDSSCCGCFFQSCMDDNDDHHHHNHQDYPEAFYEYEGNHPLTSTDAVITTTTTTTMIIGSTMDKNPDSLVAVAPTRGIQTKQPNIKELSSNSNKQSTNLYMNGASNNGGVQSNDRRSTTTTNPSSSPNRGGGGGGGGGDTMNNNNRRTNGVQSSSWSRAGGPSPPGGRQREQKQRGVPIPSCAGLAAEHVWGSVLLFVACGMALIPSVGTVVFWRQAGAAALGMACNTLLYWAASIPAAASQVYKEHVFVQYKQPVPLHKFNLVLSLFEFVFVCLLAPLIFPLQGVGAWSSSSSSSSTDGGGGGGGQEDDQSSFFSEPWYTVYPSAEFSENFQDGFLCFVRVLNVQEQQHKYPEPAFCDYVLLWTILHALCIIAVGVAVDRMVSAAAGSCGSSSSSSNTTTGTMSSTTMPESRSRGSPQDRGSCAATRTTTTTTTHKPNVWWVAMHRGMGTGIVLAVVAMTVYYYTTTSTTTRTTLWMPFGNGTAATVGVELWNGLCLVVLLWGYELYHYVHMSELTFETVYPRLDNLYDQEV